MKRLFILCLAVMLGACTQEPYQEAHRFGNTYFLVQHDNLDTLLKLEADGKNQVYNEAGKFNLEAFTRVQNDVVWFSGDTIFVEYPADYLYYDGDKTGNQDWYKGNQVNYLKMLLPVKSDSLYLLSISKQNY